jgi:hypothetical protein
MQNLSLTLERGVDSRVVLEILVFPRSAISGFRDFRLPRFPAPRLPAIHDVCCAQLQLVRRIAG